jgi:CPA1 family monovalent cation:H+ antiporter
MSHLHPHESPLSRLARLRELSLFAELPEGALRHVDTLTCEVGVPTGTVLIRQGQVGREAFVVAAGVAEVAVDGWPVAHVGAGEPLGEIALLEGGRRTATVTAATPMSLLVMDPGQFSDLVSDPCIAQRIDAVQSRRRGAAGPTADGESAD